jgi:CheY-like chemotaxis protein
LAGWRTSILDRSIYQVKISGKTSQAGSSPVFKALDGGAVPAELALGKHGKGILFAFWLRLFQGDRMTLPLALVVYEKLLPGSQILNRLQDLNYRVQAISDAESLVECAEQDKPLVVLADVGSNHQHVCAAISRLRHNPATEHLPVIAFGAENTPEVQAAAREAGATLVAGESAILNHLPQFLDQALQLD